MNFNVNKIVLILLFMATVAVFSFEKMVVHRVEIEGNKRFSKQKIMKLMDVKLNEHLPMFWPEKSFKALYEAYHLEGYYFVKVDSFDFKPNKDSTQVNLFLSLNEGEPLSIRKLNLNVSDYILEKYLKDQLSIEENRIFNSNQLTNDIEYMLDYLQNNGYPLAKITLDSTYIAPPAIDLFLHVDLGAEITLSEIHFQGNKYTNPDYLIRETRLKPGELFRYKSLNQARDHLSRLSIFKKVEDPKIYFYENKAHVTYLVEEGNASIMDGVLGYIPPKSNEKKGTVTGRLQFEFRNILGTGRFLEAYWEKKDKYSQAMRFGFEEPWIFGYPCHAGFQFSQEIRDTTYLEREWRVPLVYAPFTSLKFSLEGGQRSVLPDSVGSLVYNVPKSQMSFLSLRLQYNTFDDLLNPRKGVFYHTLFTLGRKMNLGPDYLIESLNIKDKVEDRRIEIDVETIFPIFQRQALFLGLHGVEVKSEGPFIPVSDQIRLGGAKTLRGYEEDFFRGTLVTWLNSEYRYFIGRQSRAFVFFDAGYFQRKETEHWIRQTKLGYGFGIRLETRLGLLGIDYGLGESDAPLQGKIHVGMVNRF